MCSSDENRHRAEQEEKSAVSTLPLEGAPHPALWSMVRRLEEQHARELFFYYRHPWQLIWINFLAGLFRGVGLTVGTALFLAVAAYVLGKFITLPVIGEYIARLLDIIDTYRSSGLYR